MSKYPDRVPVIVEFGDRKKKYLVLREEPMIRLRDRIRAELVLGSESAFFLLAQQTMILHTSTVGSVYDQYKNAEGILVLECTVESVFGSLG
jgi:GABA(A) receptor-associated protein